MNGMRDVSPAEGSRERTIRVAVGVGYDVVIGCGLLPDVGPRLASLWRTRRVAVFTDSNVAALYLPVLETSLRAAGFSVISQVFPAGESAKNFRVLADFLEFLAENGLTRQDGLIALGGGVTGDLAGFAAGCYLRGVPFIQIPTTLLAAVDASVGGKTAVDLAAGKNLAGLFYQPEAVFCDIDCLQTLDATQYTSGLAEAIKTAVLLGDPLFQAFETATETVLPSIRLSEIIADCVAYKAAVVMRDEKENGERKLLNLGHTFGHAIEKCSGYTLPHGHAVAAGLGIMARGAVQMGWSDAGIARRIDTVLRKNKLPIHTHYSRNELMAAVLVDKKRSNKGITVVIPEKIGRCVLREMDLATLERLLLAGLMELPS